MVRKSGREQHGHEQRDSKVGATTDYINKHDEEDCAGAR